MKKRQNASLRASALKTTFISVSVILLTLGASPARNRFENNPAGVGVTLKVADRHPAVSASSATPKQTDSLKSALVEFSVSHQRVDGREITGFSAGQTQATQEENLTPPAGLKPVEQEAWLAVARRQRASGGTGLASFYPARYGEPFVVEGEGVRVAVRPVGGTDVSAHIDNGQVIYREAYSETDSVHVASAGRSEEFLFLQNECAPREFTYELSELSAGTRVELVKGEVRFTNEAGHGVKIEAPWLIEATGAQPAGAVRWELEESKSGALPRLRLVVAKGLIYPVLVDPSWVTTGSMSDARYAHTATLLPSGKVLVAGGTSIDGSYLGSAELYDPATGSWSSTGSFFTKRSAHTAVLLPSGKVLVAGGFGNSGGNSVVLSSAELYDPATGTWTPTGSLNTARAFHTATLLFSGKVLVAGGQPSFSGYLNSAELYDPATGSWSTTGSLAVARGFHTTTLLPSGKVLVAGGNNSGVLSSAELYDPATGTWTATGSLITARSGHTATLLPSGKVLVAGGRTSGFLWPRSVELYDPATGSWSNTGSLTTERQFHTATLLPSGKVLVEGGAACCGAMNSAEFYDPATGNWSSTANLGTARRFHTATLLPSGKVLVAGGTGNNNVLNNAELYDPAKGLWTATGSLSTARYAHTATLLPSGKVLVTGGYNTDPLSSAELYDSATGVWTSTSSLGTARYSHTATLLPSAKVLVAGGIGNGSSYFSSAELYDPGTGNWSSTGSLGTARASHTATLLPSGNALVAGGLNTGFLSSAELYDPGTGSWSSTGNLGTARASHTATLLPSAKVLVAGGFSGGSSFSSAELYDSGLGFDPSWQPLLTSVSPSILANGSAITGSGSRFKGISEASGGHNFQNSSSNYPLVQLLSLANEQTLFLGVDATKGWSDTSFASTPITLMTTSSSGFPIGHALVTVFANGIPGQSQFVVGTTATPSPTATPTSVRVNVGTNPVGRAFSVDGTTYSSQQHFTWLAGSSHTIATTSPQSGGPGVQYVWGKWSDHGTISHIVIPTTNKTYTATFQTQYFLTMSAGAGGTVTPASGWQDAGKRVTIRARPNRGFTFVDWVGSGTGSYTGTNDPASITMGGPISETANFSP